MPNRDGGDAGRRPVVLRLFSDDMDQVRRGVRIGIGAIRRRGQQRPEQEHGTAEPTHDLPSNMTPFRSEIDEDGEGATGCQ